MIKQEIDSYLRELRSQDFSPLTFRHRKQVLLAWARWQEARGQINSVFELSARDLELWLKSLRRKKLSEESVENYYFTLKNLLKHIQSTESQKRGHLVNDCLSQRKDLLSLLPSLKRKKQKLKATLNENDVELFLYKLSQLRTLIEKRDTVIASLLYASGLRVGELTNLKLQDLDLKQAEISVREGKGRKGRRVPLLKSLTTTIATYIQEVRSHLLLRAAPGEEHLFLGNRGRPVDKLAIERRFRIYRRRFDLPETLTPHELRRAFSLHMLRRGMNIRDIQQLLGHERLSTTERYTRLTDKDLLKAVDEYHFFRDNLGEVAVEKRCDEDEQIDYN